MVNQNVIGSLPASKPKPQESIQEKHMYPPIEQAKCVEQQAIMLSLANVFDHHKIPSDIFARLHDFILFQGENPTPRALAHTIQSLRPLLESDCQLVEDLVLAVFAGTHLFDPLHNATLWLPQPKSVADLFGATRKEALQKYPHLSNRSPLYYARTPLFTWSAFTSMRPATMLLGSFFPYDPKAVACNSSGLLFQESDGLDWSVGPTPTLGDKLAPETCALLRALKRKKSELFPYTKWVYINLQNTRSPSERRRSKALLDASLNHPDEFRLASISVDAPFYRDMVKNLQTLDDHRACLEKEIHTAIDHPSRPSWYAFALLPEERKEWTRIVDVVIESAYELGSGHSPVVFHELVVLGLARAWQRFCTKNSSGKVLSTIACKECIDRGGSVNSAFRWALHPTLSEQQRTQQVKAILWGRPLLSRYRLILPSRTRGFEALVDIFPPDVVRSFLAFVWRKT